VTNPVPTTPVSARPSPTPSDCRNALNCEKQTQRDCLRRSRGAWHADHSPLLRYTGPISGVQSRSNARVSRIGYLGHLGDEQASQTACAEHRLAEPAHKCLQACTCMAHPFVSSSSNAAVMKSVRLSIETPSLCT
jgi:hypothetical protein